MRNPNEPLLIRPTVATIVPHTWLGSALRKASNFLFFLTGLIIVAESHIPLIEKMLPPPYDKSVPGFIIVIAGAIKWYYSYKEAKPGAKVAASVNVPLTELLSHTPAGEVEAKLQEIIRKELDKQK